MKKMFLGFTIGNDPHTEGLFKAGNIAKMAGVDILILAPGETLKFIVESINKYNPDYIGLSYRLSPEVGVRS